MIITPEQTLELFKFVLALKRGDDMTAHYASVKTLYAGNEHCLNRIFDTLLKEFSTDSVTFQSAYTACSLNELLMPTEVAERIRVCAEKSLNVKSEDKAGIITCLVEITDIADICGNATIHAGIYNMAAECMLRNDLIGENLELANKITSSMTTTEVSDMPRYILTTIGRI